jgi:hypothetical protein
VVPPCFAGALQPPPTGAVTGATGATNAKGRAFGASLHAFTGDFPRLLTLNSLSANELFSLVGRARTPPDLQAKRFRSRLAHSVKAEPRTENATYAFSFFFFLSLSSVMSMTILPS